MLNVIGDVEGRNVLIVDDIIDTAGTLTKAVDALPGRARAGCSPRRVHGVLSGPALERINDSGLEQVLITNTMPGRGEARALPEAEALSVAPLLGEAIRRIHDEELRELAVRVEPPLEETMRSEHEESSRREASKRPARARTAVPVRGGRIPAVVYGGGKESVSIEIDRKSMLDLIRRGRGSENPIYLLKLRRPTSRHAMIRELQRDPVSRKPLHIDFLRVLMDRRSTSRCRSSSWASPTA